MRFPQLAGHPKFLRMLAMLRLTRTLSLEKSRPTATRYQASNLSRQKLQLLRPALLPRQSICIILLDNQSIKIENSTTGRGGQVCSS